MLKQDRVGASAGVTVQFLRIPPFPGSKVDGFELMAGAEYSADGILPALRGNRVGGTYWGPQPNVPKGSVLIRCAEGLDDARNLYDGRDVILWPEGDGKSADTNRAVPALSDPWHLLDGAAALVCRPDDSIALIANILGVVVHAVTADANIAPVPWTAAQWVERLFPKGTTYRCPFTGKHLSAVDAVGLCGRWRRLIDSNRAIVGGYGFAFWKKEAVAPLLWNGATPFRFLSGAKEARAGQSAAVWRSRTSPSVVSELEESGVSLVEVEDGFLRSRGLGADCVPPLSIVVDPLRPYFDPAGPSGLERLLQEGAFDAELVRAAADLRRRIVDAGLGKYESGGEPIRRFDPGRQHILVPGQVEDDRSVQTGGAGINTNIELLRRVRSAEPDAFIVYKPHPDVVAGHRLGDTPQRKVLEYADRVVTDLPIAALLDMVDGVHVNTSLTGFEALLRDKPVTTHGVPFYAGWGLTIDLGPVPERRTTRRTIDELVAATLILYPRYLDPVTGLPCPAEVAVDRLAAGQQRGNGAIIALRRLQGRALSKLRGLRR